MTVDNLKYSYSLTDIAKQLGKPRTTVQDWRNQFKEYLPTVPGTTGRTTRYDADALALFQVIAHMKEANEPVGVIEKALKENTTAITENDKDHTSKPSIQPGFYEELKQLTVLLEEQRQLNKTMMTELQALRQQQTEYHHELMDLLNRQNHLEENIRTRDFRLLETMRDMQEKKQNKKQRGGLFSLRFSK